MQLQSPVPGTDNWNDFGFSERLELGYQFDCCGLRARYWHFDESYQLIAGTPEIDMRFKFNVLDLEATDRKSVV